MKSIQRTLGVCVLALGATAFAAETVSTRPAEPAYNPKTVVDIDGTIAAVRTVPAGSPLEGVHLTVKTKTASVDVYLAPTEFLKIFKTSFPVGNEVEVVGSKVKLGSDDVILTREVFVGQASITLRDQNGASDWTHWGVEIDPSAVRY